MYIDTELVLSSYKPLKLEKGMLFIKLNEETPEMYELVHTIYDAEAYMMNNGCPVEAKLFESSVSHPYSNQLATHNEIGWIDEGDESEDMHEITIDDFNVILKNKMCCQVQCLDNSSEGMHIPVYDEEKVIIKLIKEETE